MWLINTETLRLEEYTGSQIPSYAILSHTWEGHEVTLQEFRTFPGAISSVADRCSWVARDARYEKIHHTCRLAREKGIGHAWIDTCCIDKTSSAELTEAINSMYQWYERSEVCFAFLSDLIKPQEDDDAASVTTVVPTMASSDVVVTPTSPKASTRPQPQPQQPQQGQQQPQQQPPPALNSLEAWSCRWFTRGWTLQELIASRRVEFYDSAWEYRGTKEDHAAMLSGITGVDKAVLLRQQDLLSSVPVARRMSWAARRQTTREEDLAYSLLGIFGVHMPLLYGEGGEGAFLRLQEEILKTSNDLTLFAWRAKNRSQRYRGCLATSPAEFAHSGDVITPYHQELIGEEFAMTNKGLRINTRLYCASNGRYVMPLHCRKATAPPSQQMCVCLRMHGRRLYARDMADSFQLLTSEALADRAFVEGGGPIYVMRAVDAGLSDRLAASHRHAVVFRGGLFEEDRRRRVKAVSPPELYDPHRGIVLTGGACPFVGSARVALGLPPGGGGGGGGAGGGDAASTSSSSSLLLDGGGGGGGGASSSSAPAYRSGPFAEIIFGVEAGGAAEVPPKPWVDIAPVGSRDAERMRKYPGGRTAATLNLGVLRAVVTLREEQFEGQPAYLLDLIVRG